MLRSILLCAAIVTASETGVLAADFAVSAMPENICWGYYWSKAKPAVKTHSGDRVTVQTVSGNPTALAGAGVPDDQLTAVKAIYDKVTDKGPGGHLLTGAIYVEEAEPGDTLEVQIEKITLDVPYAYNAFGPGRGFLPDDFPYARYKVIPLDREHMLARFAPGIEIPLRPFFGSMGVSPPPGTGRLDSAPPWIHAGNMDNKELVAGTTLFVPVHAKGALFEVGDGHAGQGNGEVDITAMETSLTGTFTFIVHKGKMLRWPRAETPTHYITMGFNQDLTKATELAVKDMIDLLVSERHLSRDDAYMLTSVAVDVDITQLVDGNKGVHAMLSKAIFEVK